MNIRIIFFLLLALPLIADGQNKKELKLTVVRLQSDSTALEARLKENMAVVSNLNSELTTLTELIEEQKVQIADLLKEREANARLSDSILRLNDSIQSMHGRLDSINSYFRIINFVKAFYNSLEMSDEENLRQFEFGDVKFDLENFYSLVAKNARFSEGRVKNLSDDRNHDKYYIQLESIEDIKFSLDRILVKTKVMYSGDKMGLFYNEEQLTLRDSKGLIKLTDWVDLDLYKMAPTIDASVENFSRDDFYKWLDGNPKK